MVSSLDYKVGSSGPFFFLGSGNASTFPTACPLSGRYFSHTVRKTRQKSIFDASFHAAPQCNLGI